MPQKNPQTIEDELIEKIGSIGDSKYFIDPSSNFIFSQCLRDVEKLISADFQAGVGIKMRLFALMGDVEGAEKYFSLLTISKASPAQVANAAISFRLLGFYSKAQRTVTPILLPEVGMFNELYSIAISIGAYQSLLENYKKAKKANIHVNDEMFTGSVTIVAEAMSREKVIDSMIALYLDAAGDVARRRGFLTNSIISSADLINVDDREMVYQKIVIDEDPEAIAEMNLELMDLIVEYDLPKKDSIMVSFKMPEPESNNNGNNI